MTRRVPGRHRRTTARSARRLGRAAISAAMIVAATVVGVHVGATAAAATPVSSVQTDSAVPTITDGR